MAATRKTAGMLASIEQTQAHARPAYAVWILVGLITLAALALRLWGIRQNLPYVEQPDEPNPIDYVVEMLRTGDPNQQFFQKPSLYVYLLLAVLQIHYALGLAGGLYEPIGHMLITTHTVTTIPAFFFWSRVVSAVIGTLTVITAYAFNTRAWNRSAGVAGALFVATLPYHLRYSQFVTTDVTAAWLVLLCVGAALLVARSGTWTAYLTAGAFAGLAASTKYNAGIVALAVVTAATVRLFDQLQTTDQLRSTIVQQLARLCASGITAIGCFIAGTPYALLRWDQVGGGVLRQWGNYDGRNGHYRGEWNIAGYIDFFWGTGLGPLASLVVLTGLLIIMRRDRRLGIVWLGFALPSLLIHLSRPTHFMQNMLPILMLCSLPFAVTAGELIRRLHASVRRRGMPIPSYLSSTLILGLLLLPTSLASLDRARELGIGDTRTALLAWIADQVPPGARIAAELAPLPHQQERRWSEFESLTLHDLAWYRAQGFAYLVASSKRWGSLELPPAYQPLTSGGLLAEFGAREADQTLGPRLLVFSTGLTSDDVQIRPPGDLRLGGARLLGVNAGRAGAEGVEPAESYRPGETLALRSFWQVEQPFNTNLFIFVHLLDEAGNRVAQRDAPPWQGRFPTTAWRPGTLVVDVNDLYMPPDLPPGRYRLLMGMFDPVTFARPPVTLNGIPVADSMVELLAITLNP